MRAFVFVYIIFIKKFNDFKRSLFVKNHLNLFIGQIIRAIIAFIFISQLASNIKSRQPMVVIIIFIYEILVKIFK